MKPHPAEVLFTGAGKKFPALAACEHYAGSEKLIHKALALQAELGPVFDITADCEDGAPVGGEIEHAQMIAALAASPANTQRRLGARIHDVTHPLWRDEVDILIRSAGAQLAYLVLPKPQAAKDAATQIAAIIDACSRHQIKRAIPVHVLIETPGALHEAWAIAALPQVESIDFGLMDFVSAHGGAIPAAAMQSPGQFEHPLIRRAKAGIAAAALGNHIIPSHNVTTEFRNLEVVKNDAQRARNEFGFLRMWSIHPAQIQPIIAALRPELAEVDHASQILATAQDANWGPIQIQGALHDRASYRYYWDLLQRAHATGMKLAPEITRRFFAPAANIK